MARWHNLHTLYQPWFYGACTYIGLIFISICGGAPFVRTEKVRTGKCQNKKLEKVRTDFELTILVPKQENIRTENVRKEFVLIG